MKTMQKQITLFIENCCSFGNYEKLSPLEILSLRALKDRLLNQKGERAKNGILTDAWEWDFIPIMAQKKAIDRFIYKVGNAWGFDNQSAIKLSAAVKAIDISSNCKILVRMAYNTYSKSCSGTFSIHGLGAHL